MKTDIVIILASRFVQYFRINKSKMVAYCLLVLCLSVITFAENVGRTELVMVHTLFRHGERNTEFSYPTDPYINETYYPNGKGELTNHGKVQEYKLGQMLRNRYDQFLGDYVTPNIMEVRSTGFSRTRKSALLVLAGLWPPRGEQIWNQDLPWQPVPVDYKIQEEDDLLNVDKCQRRLQLLEMQPSVEAVKNEFINPYRKIMDYLEEMTGMVIKTPLDFSTLYLILKTEEGAGLELPEWTKKVFPDTMYKIGSIAYRYLNFFPENKRINSGYLLQKIINDSKSKINSNYGPDEKRIMLYSGHESTVGVLTNILGIPDHIPDYSSCVIFELHRIVTTNTYAIKILYKRAPESEKVEEIVLPGCTTYCPISKFEAVLYDVLPTVPYQVACTPVK